MIMDTKTFEKQLFDQATAEAGEATEMYLVKHPGQWYPCGFAWVTIKPARGKFVKLMKELKIGHNGTYGGWDIWNPSNHATQCMDAKEAGARAFAEVLKAAGLNCTVHTRID